MPVPDLLRSWGNKMSFALTGKFQLRFCMTQRFCDHCGEPALPSDVLQKITQDGLDIVLPATDSRIVVRLKIDHNFGGQTRPDLCRTHLLEIFTALHDSALALTIRP